MGLNIEGGKDQTFSSKSRGGAILRRPLIDLSQQNEGPRISGVTDPDNLVRDLRDLVAIAKGYPMRKMPHRRG